MTPRADVVIGMDIGTTAAKAVVRRRARPHPADPGRE